jgi:AcrR family transcriptional regulator
VSAEQTRRRILEAASELIAEDGIEAVRIARVATRAGSSTALVHHYFSTREELLTEALLRAFEVAAEERFGEELSVDGGPTATLALAIRQNLPAPQPDRQDWVLWVELWLRAARDPELRPVAARLYERYHRWIEEVIIAGVERGEFRTDDPGRVADKLMAMTDGTGLRALLDDPAMSLERAHRICAEVIAAELATDPDRLAGAVLSDAGGVQDVFR